MDETVGRERVTEEELKGRAVAPRVSEEDLERAIVGEWYLTGSQAIIATGRSAPEDMDRLTICLIQMENGFVVLGHSAPASKENFNVAIGKRLARERAVSQIWQLMGFSLKNRLHENEVWRKNLAVGAKEGFETWKGNVVVHAKSCTRAEYCGLRGWRVPEHEDPTDDGYIMELTDSKVDVVDGFDGHVTWLPKDRFEGAYKRI